MKKLIFILLAFISINLYAQDSIPQITEAERIIDKYTGQMIDFAEKTAQALEQPAKEIFESVVRLQIAKGISLLILSVLFSIMIIFSITKYENYSEESLEVPIIIFNIIAFILIPIFIYKGIQYLMAPEWWGIKEIITLF